MTTRTGLASLTMLMLCGATTAASAPAITAAQDVKTSIAERLEGKTGKTLLGAVSQLASDQRAQAEAALIFDTRIIGGVEVKNLADAPWQVALIRGVVAPERSQFCGGALIAPDTVLTAAHCVDNNIGRGQAARVDVVAGTLTYASGGERLKVTAILVHPGWNSASMNNDFAILKLASASQLGTPVILESGVVTPPGEAFVSGWGLLTEGGVGSAKLMGVKLPLVDNTQCNMPESYNGEITPQMLCAGERDGGKDSCQGDSGGPVTSLATDRLIGVVSYGEGCARRLKYGVYSRVSAAIPWIQAFGGGRVKMASSDGSGTANGR